MPFSKSPLSIVLLVVVAAVSGCRESRDAKKSRQPENGSPPSPLSDRSSPPANASRTLAEYSLDEKEPESFVLPNKLREISGIAFTPDGRLFAHGDERGSIFQLDPSNGEVVKVFHVGKDGGVAGDFEDIAIVDKTFYLVTSDGKILELAEGNNEGVVQFTEYKTSLGSRNDVEGLCYDPTTNALLLACKGDPGNGDDSHKAVYSFSLRTKQLDEKPRFLLPAAELAAGAEGDRFNTSAITYHSKSRTFLLIASSGNAIAEVSPEGKILGSLPLKRSVHIQPEGIAAGPANTLYISNEAGQGDARLTKYPARHIQ